MTVINGGNDSKTVVRKGTGAHNGTSLAPVFSALPARSPCRLPADSMRSPPCTACTTSPAHPTMGGHDDPRRPPVTLQANTMRSVYARSVAALGSVAALVAVFTRSECNRLRSGLCLKVNFSQTPYRRSDADDQRYTHRVSSFLVRCRPLPGPRGLAAPRCLRRSLPACASSTAALPPCTARLPPPLRCHTSTCTASLTCTLPAA
eukprot:scaffold3358_cov63-Phaeocystis_antarctica.AAC.2